MKDIVLVGVSPLVKRRLEVFCLEELITKGFKVTHCDLSPCLFDNLHYENILNLDFAIEFTNLSSFEEYLKNIDIINTIFIVELPHTSIYKPIFYLMAKYKCLCVKINPNASDFTGYNFPIIESLEYFGLQGTLVNMLYPLKDMIKNYFYGDNYNIYSYYISSGNNPKINIHINQLDWERSRSMLCVRPIPTCKYAVFCDEYFPVHPDYYYLGGINKIDKIKRKYRYELNTFFDYIEKKYSVRIIVAAHPKSNYKGNEFGDREIILGKTMELVKNAEFAIVHGSMSIAYSIIFNIPIILATTDDMEKIYSCNLQSSIYSRFFKLPLYNISRDSNAYSQSVSAAIRHRYIYDFLTSPGIEDKHNADILAEAFAKM